MPKRRTLRWCDDDDKLLLYKIRCKDHIIRAVIDFFIHFYPTFIPQVYPVINVDVHHESLRPITEIQCDTIVLRHHQLTQQPVPVYQRGYTRKKMSLTKFLFNREINAYKPYQHSTVANYDSNRIRYNYDEDEEEESVSVHTHFY